MDGEFSHIHWAHILNLIMEDGFEIIGRSVEQICYSVDYWIQQIRSPKIISRHQNLTLDYSTWNSTYMMLNIALQYKLVFPPLKQ